MKRITFKNLLITGIVLLSWMTRQVTLAQAPELRTGLRGGIGMATYTSGTELQKPRPYFEASALLLYRATEWWSLRPEIQFNRSATEFDGVSFDVATQSNKPYTKQVRLNALALPVTLRLAPPTPLRRPYFEVGALAQYNFGYKEAVTYEDAAYQSLHGYGFQSNEDVSTISISGILCLGMEYHQEDQRGYFMEFRYLRPLTPLNLYSPSLYYAAYTVGGGILL